MKSVEKVKLLCRERKIPISRLERDLGFSNGYIGQLKKGSFPGNRLADIANYLGVTISYLLGEEEQKNKPTDNGELTQKDIQLVNWFRSLPKETRQAILTLGAAPKGLDD